MLTFCTVLVLLPRDIECLEAAVALETSVPYPVKVQGADTVHPTFAMHTLDHPRRKEVIRLSALWWTLNRHLPLSVDGIVLHFLELSLWDDSGSERVISNSDGVSKDLAKTLLTIHIPTEQYHPKISTGSNIPGWTCLFW